MLNRIERKRKRQKTLELNVKTQSYDVVKSLEPEDSSVSVLGIFEKILKLKFKVEGGDTSEPCLCYLYMLFDIICIKK